MINLVAIFKYNTAVTRGRKFLGPPFKMNFRYHRTHVQSFMLLSKTEQFWWKICLRRPTIISNGIIPGLYIRLEKNAIFTDYFSFFTWLICKQSHQSRVFCKTCTFIALDNSDIETYHWDQELGPEDVEKAVTLMKYFVDVRFQLLPDPIDTGNVTAF